MRRSQERAELLLEAAHLVAENEPSALEDPGNRRVDGGALDAVVVGQGAERHAGSEAGRARAHLDSATSPVGGRA